MADIFNQLKDKFDAIAHEWGDTLDKISPTRETGEKPLVSTVEKFREKLEIQGQDTSSTFLTWLNKELARYGVILKDDLDKIEERIDRLEAEMREL